MPAEPKLMPTEVAFKQALRLEVGTAVSAEAKAVIKMQEAAKKGKLSESMQQAIAIGSARERQETDDTLSKLHEKNQSMGHTLDENGDPNPTRTEKANRKKADQTLTTFEKFAGGGYEKLEPDEKVLLLTHAKQLVMERAIATGITLDPAQIDTAASNLVQDPRLRHLLFPQLKHIEENTNFADVRTAQTQRAEQNKLKKEAEDAKTVAETSLTTANQQFHDEYSDEAMDNQDSHGYKLRDLEDHADSRRSQVNTKERVIAGIQFQMEAGNLDRQKGYERIDKLETEIRELQKQDREMERLRRMKTKLQNQIETETKNIAMYEKNIKDTDARIKELDSELELSGRLRDIQETRYANALDNALDYALGELLNTRLQEALTQWEADLPKAIEAREAEIAENKAKNEAKNEEKKQAEETQKKQEAHVRAVKIARAITDRYIDYKRTPKMEKQGRFGRTHKVGMTTTREFKPALDEDYELLFSTDIQEIDKVIEDIYTKAGVTPPANEDEKNAARAQFINDVIRVRDMESQDPSPKHGQLKAITKEDQENIILIHGDQPYFDEFIFQSMQNPRTQAAMTQNLGMTAEEIKAAAAEKDPVKQKSFKDKVNDVLHKTPTALMIIAGAYTALSNMAKTEETR